MVCYASINIIQKRFGYLFGYTALRTLIDLLALVQRHRADIVNLHRRRALSNQELKPESVRPSCGKL